MISWIPLVCLSIAAKEGAKTASSVGVIAFGLGVTGIILYTVFNELFSGSGPTKAGLKVDFWQ